MNAFILCWALDCGRFNAGSALFQFKSVGFNPAKMNNLQSC